MATPVSTGAGIRFLDDLYQPGAFGEVRLTGFSRGASGFRPSSVHDAARQALRLSPGKPEGRLDKNLFRD